MSKAKREGPVVIAITNDQHCGSSVALAPAVVKLDDGGEHHSSKAQRWIFQCWEDYWARVEQVRRQMSAPLYQIFNGDLVEGFHHGSSQVLSANPNAQAVVVNEVMRIPLALKPEKLFLVRGTEAHVGQSASSEERIADGLRRDKRPVEGDPDTGTASWWHLRMFVGGVHLDVTHHGRTGQREHTRGSAAVLHAHDIYLSHCKRNERPPDLCLRAHYHRFNDSYDACPTRVVTNGAWQIKTGYVYKVAADSMADIGGLIVVVGNGKYTVEKVHFTAARGPVWRQS